MSVGLGWEWLGRVPYGEALGRQRARREAVLAGEAPEVVWLLEHDPPVVTVGRRQAPGTPSAEALAAHGTELYAVERGGLATWHGPGQLVAYVIVDAAGRGLGVRGLVGALEDAVIGWLSTWQVPAGRRTGHPGVWVGRDKICAVGLHFRRGVSLHGIALNLEPDLRAFDRIVPCGISDGGVTSLGALRGVAPTPEVAAPTLAGALTASIEGATEVHRREHNRRSPA